MRVMRGLRGGQKLSVRDGLEGCNFHFRDGDVRIRAFLNIHKADFDGPAVEAGDGAAAVQEVVVEQVLRVVRGDGFLYFVENLLVVFVVGVRLFRDDLSRDFGDFVLVVAVDFDSGILQSAVFAVQVRTACGDGRNEWQKKAYGGVEFREFAVAVKRKVQVRTLQIRPAVAFAVENAVVGLVDFVAIVGPELHFGRVHERVRCARQKHGVYLFQLLVRAADFVEESLAEPVKCGLGVGALEFEYVAYEFVRKSDVVVINVGELVAVLVFSERHVGAREHLQRVLVDNHEFHFDAEAFP